VLEIVEEKSSMGFSGVLTIIFIVLKLFSIITWSWWLVFLPLIIDFVLSMIASLLATYITWRW